MITILISLVAGALVSGILLALHLFHSQVAVIVPGLIVAVTVLILLFRRAAAKINPLVEEAQRHLTGGRKELALKALEKGLELRRYHPLLEGQLRMQIGALLYANGDIDRAIAELSQASKRPWESRAFLGCAYYKKKNTEEMVKAFNTAIKVGDKDSLSYSTYAFCLIGRGQKAEAIAVLKKGLEKLPADTKLKANLEAAQEGKKLKMSAYGDRWMSFGLDGAVPGLPKAARGFAQRPGFRQKPARR